MKKSTARKINATTWIVLVSAIMIYTYCIWSGGGGYAIGSFIASLFLYVGGGAIGGIQIDDIICKWYDKD